MHSTDPYGPQSYDVYERMARPNSLTGAAKTHIHTQTVFLTVVVSFSECTTLVTLRT